jgi:transaldolase
MKPTSLRDLQTFGQSVWLNELRDSWLSAGVLSRWITNEGITGITSKPADMRQAIQEDELFRDKIRKHRGKPAAEIHDALLVDMLRAAAEKLRSVYEITAGTDGFVCAGITPHLAHDSAGICVEAQRLWAAVDAPNVMIKVPATTAGLGAIRALTAKGINVHAMLIAGVERYREVAEAFFAGLEDRLALQLSVRAINSVASFSVSRIDSDVDQYLDTHVSDTTELRTLRGRAGLAVARLAYEVYKKLLATPRWQSLAAHGASPQRLLWASTSTRDPAYGDMKYLNALIGRGTIVTASLHAIEAFCDHGRPVPLDSNATEVVSVPAALLRHGVDLAQVARQLELHSVAQLRVQFDALFAGLAKCASSAREPAIRGAV